MPLVNFRLIDFLVARKSLFLTKNSAKMHPKNSSFVGKHLHYLCKKKGKFLVWAEQVA